MSNFPPPPPAGASRPPMPPANGAQPGGFQQPRPQQYVPGQRPPPPPPSQAGAQQMPPPGWRPPAGAGGIGAPPQFRPAPQPPQQQNMPPPPAISQAQQYQPQPQTQGVPAPQQMQMQVQMRPQQLPPMPGAAVSPAQQYGQPLQRPLQQPQPQQQRPQYLPPQAGQNAGGGMGALTQQMGSMGMGMGMGQQQQQQQQPQSMHSPPPGTQRQTQTQNQRTRRAYVSASPVPGVTGQMPPAGYPPISGAGQAQGYPGAQPAGYPPMAGAPLGGPQTFVPGAQAPTPVASGAPGSPYGHATGQQPQMVGQPAPFEPPKPRIDPSQLPTPIAVHARDQGLFAGQPYSTANKTTVPIACTEYTAVDEGNSNPRFVRLTMNNIPKTAELLKASHLPMGMIVQPLADLAAGEEAIKLIDFGEEGPIRCLRCKTYINPHMAFINGGKTFVCNMCRHENDVPADYFCNLDMMGRRLDCGMRPELRNGSVEFVATKDFIARPPEAASFVFAIDVTWAAVQSGMVAQAAAAIKAALYGGAGLPAGARVGIITFDRSAHFYSLAPTLEQAQMMVVPDVQDMFVPLHEGLVVDPLEARHLIEPLLDSLPAMFAKNHAAEPVLGAVVQATHEALRGRGGKLVVFQTALPTFGPGSLKQRDDAKLHNTDKERSLYEPQDAFYRDWAVKLVEEGICCSLYLFPSAYMDAATLSQLSTLTGGELYSYPAFEGGRDGRRLASDVCADVGRTYGSNAVLRIRTSDGLRVDEHYGNLFMRNHVDVELAGVTSDTAIAAVLQHDGKLDENQDVYFQMALLYTTSDGQRRIRVHNLAIPCTTLIGNLFKFSDVDTSMNLVSKIAVAEALTTPLRSIREKLTDQCVQIHTAYRRNCATHSSPAQLILSESYKLSPLYTLSLLKSPAIRSGADVPIDQRIYHMCLLRQFSVRKSLDYLYPTIAPLHSLAENEGLPDEATGVIAMPPLVRASYPMLDVAGAYLLSSGGHLILWLGRQVSPTFLQEALGVPSLESVDVGMHALPELSTALSQKVRNIAAKLVPARAGFASIQIARQGMDRAETPFALMLVEDRNNDNMSYVDFLCAIHRQIQIETRPKENQEPKWSYN
ncbi:COPII coat Sec23p-Sfb3p heterodimer component [Coemansia sp. Benny D115]|nr:COPII coat Sec23p-Sfb3p heterodimer component [Coemansia sp. Benny D115]